jgi:tetratricopeptide (TPR) repeat protein
MKSTAILSAALALISAICPDSALPQDPAVNAPAKKPAPPLTLVEARAFFAARDWARAAEAYREVLKSNPHDGEHWFNYGMCLYSLKRFDEAIKAFDKASELVAAHERSRAVRIGPAVFSRSQSARNWSRSSRVFTWHLIVTGRARGYLAPSQAISGWTALPRLSRTATVGRSTKLAFSVRSS